MSVQKNKPPDEPGCPLWMLSFGDTMSLLVTFFVLLLAFSDTNDAQLMDVAGAMKGAFKVLPSAFPASELSKSGNTAVKDREAFQDSKTYVDGEQSSKLSANVPMMSKTFARNSVGDYDRGYFFSVLDEGLTVKVYAERLFKPGTAELLPGKEEMLGVVVDLTGTIMNEVRIVGVVPNNVKIGASGVSSPWGLAAKRAIAIRNSLMSRGIFTADRFGVGVKVEDYDLPPTTKHEDLMRERIEFIIVGYDPDETVVRPEKVVTEGL